MNTADPRKALRPLTSDLVAHLNQKLGLPAQHFIDAEGRRIRTRAWIIGTGTIEATGSRGITVTIYLTEGGFLIPSRHSWTRGDTSTDSYKSDGRETPQAVLDWLIEDGKGKLGPASKEAWIQACRNVPPMADFEFENIE